MKIGMIGTGYVGLVSGTCFSEMGHEVFCVDRDEQKINGLRKGVLPIYEPGLEEMVARNMKEERLFFTTQLSEAVQACDILFIAVGTPPGEDGRADLSYVLGVARQIAETMTDYRVIITKSTVPVGTGKRIRQEISEVLKKRGLSFAFDLVSNPEFLKEGAAIDDCMKPDRIVVGVETEKARSLMARLYEPFVRQGCPLLVMDIASSEMTKYAANALLATKISFMNEISQVCEKVGADVESVRLGIAADIRIGPHFISAGLGYGGSCFPKDVSALLRSGKQLHEPMWIMEAVEKVNQEQRKRFIQKIINRLFREEKPSSLAKKVVAVWGLSFKPGTDDIRDAPSLDLIRALLHAGAEVVAYDPVATPGVRTHFQADLDLGSSLRFVKDQYMALVNADALCLVTEWKCFLEPDFKKIKDRMKTPLIFDGRNQYHPQNLRSLGFEYHSVGRVLLEVDSKE